MGFLCALFVEGVMDGTGGEVMGVASGPIIVTPSLDGILAICGVQAVVIVMKLIMARKEYLFMGSSILSLKGFGLCVPQV